MSNNRNAPAAQAERPVTIMQYLAANQRAIKAALPKHMTPDRLSRIAMLAIEKTPTLKKADVGSLFGAIMECAKWGLEPGIRAHLVPYWNKSRGVFLVNYIPDYRGLIDLARRSGEIGPFYAAAVREFDEFDYELGLEPKLVHKPAEGPRGEITYFYAVAKARDGSWSQFDVMTRADVDAIRDRSAAGRDGPWVTDYEAMGCKTVVRRLCKFLPASVELQKVVMDDEAAERGEQNTTSWIDGEFVVEDEAPLRDQVRRRSEEPPAQPESFDLPSFLDRIEHAADVDALDLIRSEAKEHLKDKASLKSAMDALEARAAALNNTEDNPK